MIRLARLALAIIVLIAMFAAASRVLGQRSPVTSADIFTPTQDPTRCKTPCWHGITPQMTLDDAEALLRADHDLVRAIERTAWSLCWEMQSVLPWKGCYYPKSAYIRLEPTFGAVRLGDVLAVLGEPRVASYCVEQWYSSGITTYRARSVLQFRNIRVLAGQSIETTGSRVDPNMVVGYVEYRLPDRFPTMPWLGFKKRSIKAGCAR